MRPYDWWRAHQLERTCTHDDTRETSFHGRVFVLCLICGKRWSQ